MSWDPTDYKDMIEDDWNTIYEKVENKWKEMASEGYDLNSIISEICQILGNIRAYEDIIDYANRTKNLKDIIDYIMNNHYLTPVARKRAKRKMNENIKKIVKESLQEDITIDDVYDELTREQQKYIDTILNNTRTIKAIFRDEEYWRNGGWNGMMDAIEEFQKRNGIVTPDFDDLEDKGIDIWDLIMKDLNK